MQFGLNYAQWLAQKSEVSIYGIAKVGAPDVGRDVRALPASRRASTPLRIRCRHGRHMAMGKNPKQFRVVPSCSDLHARLVAHLVGVTREVVEVTSLRASCPSSTRRREPVIDTNAAAVAAAGTLQLTHMSPGQAAGSAPAKAGGVDSTQADML